MSVILTPNSWASPQSTVGRGLLVFSLITLLGGCTGRKAPEVDPPGVFDKEGLILVDSPEVFARERLVRDREQQKKWLQDQLTVPDAWFDAVQAGVQSRSLHSSNFSLGIDASPAAGLAIRQADAEAENLQRQQELADLNHQIAIAKLEADLQKVLAGETPSEPQIIAMPNAAAGAGTGSSSSGSGDTTAASAGSASSAAAAATPAAGAAADPPAGPPPNPPNLPGFASAHASTVKDTPTDRFRDRLAYREAVRQELLENDLDDAHDLAGNTVYRLTFDTTVIPHAEGSSTWANVEVQIKQSPCKANDTGLRSLMRSFLDDFELFLEAEARSYRDALLAPDPNQFYDSGVGRLVLSSEESTAFRLNRARRKLTPEPPRDGSPPDMTEEEKAKEEADRSKVLAACKTAEYYRQQLIRNGFGGLIDFLHPSPQECSSWLANTPPIAESEIGFSVSWKDCANIGDLFCRATSALQQRIEPYAVTPKESVERIADAAIAKFSHEAAISAGIALGTVNLTSGLEYLNVLENQREAVRRAPLVVGYSERYGSSDEESRIGWVLGPRFSPRFSEPGFDFKHRQTQFPLSSVVSVPAWWTSLTLKVWSRWGTPETTAPPSGGKDYKISLPGDPGGLLEVLFPRARRPQPFFLRICSSPRDRSKGEAGDSWRRSVAEPTSLRGQSES